MSQPNLLYERKFSPAKSQLITFGSKNPYNNNSFVCLKG